MCILGLALAAVACARVSPPAGRWEGTYDGGDTMAAVRLEIDSRGEIFLAAPDALNLPPLPVQQRLAMHNRLAQGLSQDWGAVTHRHYEFDGQTFRKPGGFAPQMEWDAPRKQMTVIVYLERRPGIRIRMRRVVEFSA